MITDYEHTQDLVHDMRSPLAALSLNIELLQKQMIGPLTQKQKDMLVSMKQSVDKLTHMLAHAKFQ